MILNIPSSIRELIYIWPLLITLNYLIYTDDFIDLFSPFQQQLGYIVFSGIRRSNGVQGLRIIVQSNKHPAFLDERIEEFLKNMKVSFD